MVWTRPAACLALPACVELAALACHFDLPTRDSMAKRDFLAVTDLTRDEILRLFDLAGRMKAGSYRDTRSEEHTSELQSRLHLVCRLLLEKKKKQTCIRSLTAHMLT